jgi:hypothetical protein
MCNHSEAEKDTEVADGACPICQAEELKKLRQSLAKCLMVLSEQNFSMADDLAEKHFSTWNEIQQIVKGEMK